MQERLERGFDFQRLTICPADGQGATIDAVVYGETLTYAQSEGVHTLSVDAARLRWPVPVYSWRWVETEGQRVGLVTLRALLDQVIRTPLRYGDERRTRVSAPGLLATAGQMIAAELQEWLAAEDVVTMTDTHMEATTGPRIALAILALLGYSQDMELDIVRHMEQRLLSVEQV